MAHPAAQRSAKYTIKDYGYNKLERAVWERKNLGPLGQETAGSSRWNKREVQGQRSFWSDDGQTESQCQLTLTGIYTHCPGCE